MEQASSIGDSVSRRGGTSHRISTWVRRASLLLVIGITGLSVTIPPASAVIFAAGVGMPFPMAGVATGAAIGSTRQITIDFVSDSWVSGPGWTWVYGCFSVTESTYQSSNLFANRQWIFRGTYRIEDGYRSLWREAEYAGVACGGRHDSITFSASSRMAMDAGIADKFVVEGRLGSLVFVASSGAAGTVCAIDPEKACVTAELYNGSQKCSEDGSWGEGGVGASIGAFAHAGWYSGCGNSDGEGVKLRMIEAGAGGGGRDLVGARWMDGSESGYGSDCEIVITVVAEHRFGCPAPVPGP